MEVNIIGNLTQQAGSFIGTVESFSNTVESFSKSAEPFTRTTPIWIYNKDEQLKLIIDPKAIYHITIVGTRNN